MKLWKFSITRNRPGPSMPGLAYDEIGDEVSVEGIICQAAQAIDIAGKLAAEERDSGAMLHTAEYWTKLADFIVALSEHQDKKRADKKKSDLPMGFQPKAAEQDDEHEITVEDEEEIVRDDTD